MTGELTVGYNQKAVCSWDLTYLTHPCLAIMNIIISSCSGFLTLPQDHLCFRRLKHKLE